MSKRYDLRDNKFFKSRMQQLNLFSSVIKETNQIAVGVSLAGPRMGFAGRIKHAVSSYYDMNFDLKDVPDSYFEELKVPKEFFMYRYKAADYSFAEEKENLVAEPDPTEKRIHVSINDAQRVKKIIQGVFADKTLLYKIKPREFEEIIQELLNSRGFKTELTKQTRDGGYDIIALQELGEFKNKYLVECKRFAPDRPVGIEVVRSLMHVVQENNANKGIICTTSYFSEDVKKKKEYIPYRLDLKDNEDILGWVSDFIIKH